jgi:hypothetical protein
VRHSNTIGATWYPTWVLVLYVLGCSACLNPMPEEFPSERDSQGSGAAGPVVIDPNYSNTPGNPPAPATPVSGIDLTPEVDSTSEETGMPGTGANTDPKDVGDAGVPLDTDAGGVNDGTP